MRLYDQTRTEREIENEMDRLLENGQDVPPELFAYYDAVSGERTAKLASCARWIKCLRAEADAFSNEIETLRKRQSTVLRKAESVQSYLESCFKDDEKYQDATTFLRWHKAQACEITNETELPQEFISIKQEAVIDKRALLRELRAGVAVPGAKLKESKSLVIK